MLRLSIFLSFIAIQSIALCGWCDETAKRPATKEQIATWIKDLENNDFETRENASKKLRAAGPASEAALEEAFQNGEAETKRRSGEILEDFRWGIYPATPQNVVELIRTYKSALDNNTKSQSVGHLFILGSKGRSAILKIVRAEPDEAQRRQIYTQLAQSLTQSIPSMLVGGESALLEELLEISAAGGSNVGVADYAAYWVLRGKVDEKIKEIAARLNSGNPGKWAGEALVYFYRAKGDRDKTLKVAEAIAKPELLDAVLTEYGEWKKLAARHADQLTLKQPPDLGLAAAYQRLPELGLATAYQRLAGETERFEKFCLEINKATEKKPDHDPIHMQAVKALFLNEKPEDGLRLLIKSKNPFAAFEILIAQQRYQEAFALADQDQRADPKTKPMFDLLKARTLYGLGEKDKAKSLLQLLRGQIQEDAFASWYESLIDVENRLGLKDQAYEDAAGLLAASKVSGLPARLFNRLFLDKGPSAASWWSFLRKTHADETPASTMSRARDLVAGKVNAQEFVPLAEQMEKFAKGLNSKDTARGLMAVSETAQAAGQEALRKQYLDKALSIGKTPALLIRLGDYYAEKKEWEAAANAYKEAWDEDNLQQLPLFLHGWALVQAGDEKIGKHFIELSHWLPLGQGYGRNQFAFDLGKRGYSEEEKRERALILSLGQPANMGRGQSLLQAMNDRLAANDFLAAADYKQAAMLPVLGTNAHFLENSAFVTVPFRIHQLRARGLLAAGKLEEALIEAKICQTILPDAIEPALHLIPQLEKHDRKKEADELYSNLVNKLEQHCKDYPKYAAGHNAIAWFQVSCGRNLDSALDHAIEAAKLTPDKPGYLDTLAETHFQRGGKDKAVEAIKKCIEMDPKRAYYAKQLKRFEAGDPKAALPVGDQRP